MYTNSVSHTCYYMVIILKNRFILLFKIQVSEISRTAEILQNQQTIIVMGASGSGKTTFIDAMFNYMIGVSPESDHRFKIVNLTESERKKLGHQVGFVHF